MNREQARNHLAEWLDEKMWRCFGTIDREAISIAVEALSEGKADRPTGEWTNEDGEPIKDNFYVCCSKCGEWSEYRTNYCGNCGADMRGEENGDK